jgi:pantothenate kinase
VHIFSLDGWLRPAGERPEGEGVVARYDMNAVRAVLAPLLETGSRHWVAIPEYDRSTRAARPGPRRTIGPQDVLIVEGVPALMDDFLVENSTVRIAVGIDESERRLRLQAEYTWRKEPATAVDAKIASREKDELPAVRASATRANHHIEGMAPK